LDGERIVPGLELRTRGLPLEGCKSTEVEIGADVGWRRHSAIVDQRKTILAFMDTLRVQDLRKDVEVFGRGPKNPVV
jgi:hypothetical protein